MRLSRRAASSTSDSSSGRLGTTKGRRRLPQTLPNRQGALFVHVDQERRLGLLIGEDGEVDRKGALAGSALLGSDCYHAHAVSEGKRQ
jgi:hypothetical protein